MQIQTLTRKANTVGTNYVLTLAREEKADSGAPPRPLVIVLDGDDQFPSMLSVYEATRKEGLVSPLDIVGLGYGASYRQKANRRFRDYTPSAMPGEDDTGGGPLFLNWIEADLLPWLGSEYGVGRGERGIDGHSLGSLFGLYAFFHETRLFQTCLASAPSIWYHDRKVLELIAATRARHTEWPGRLVLSVGSEDTPSMTGDLSLLKEQLTEKPFAQLQLTEQRFADRNHYNVIDDAFRAGLIALYPKSTN